MTEWNAGYVTEIGYTYGYYNELSLQRPQFVLNTAGLVAPKIETACELGFGQGLSVNIHAAAGSARWYGNDFNPAQALYARELAQFSGSGAQLSDESFAEFCTRPDLPDFDFIGLHGIWTWISDENRAVIVDFLRRKLKIGGVLYISFNVLPGWSANAPLRHLFSQHSQVMSASGQGTVQRVDAALDFTSKLLEAKPAILRQAPQLAERFKKIQQHNRQYLAHEYFNRDWKPMYFSDIAEWLAPAKLSYVGSAHYHDHLPAFSLSSEQNKLLNEISHPTFRETVRDYLTGQQFRRDYWVRGGRRLPAATAVANLRQIRVMLLSLPEQVKLTATGSMGELKLSENIYKPILEVLSDFQPRTLGEIESALQSHNVPAGIIVQAMQVLLGKADIALVQSEADIEKAMPRCMALNRHLLEAAVNSGDVIYLASPVTGGGIQVPQLHQLFLSALQEGHSTPEAWAAYIWKIYISQGRRLAKQGKTIESDEENLVELKKLAEDFAKRLPVLRALKII